MANPLLKRLSDLNKYTKTLKMTDEEIQLMNEKFGFTKEQYEGAVRKSVSRCEALAK